MPAKAGIQPWPHAPRPWIPAYAGFDRLASLADNADRAKAIIDAMESIEKDYGSLAGTLPKAEYTELDNDVLGTSCVFSTIPRFKKRTGMSSGASTNIS
jgi:type I restriction enzyme M protein